MPEISGHHSENSSPIFEPAGETPAEIETGLPIPGIRFDPNSFDYSRLQRVQRVEYLQWMGQTFGNRAVTRFVRNRTEQSSPADPASSLPAFPVQRQAHSLSHSRAAGEIQTSQTSAGIADGTRERGTQALLANFAVNSPDLKAEHTTLLDQLIQLYGLNTPHSRATLSITGYSDAQENNAQNHLRRQRARTVTNYLVHRGVNREIIEHINYASNTYPAGNNSPMERSQNRGVTVSVSIRVNQAQSNLPTPRGREGVINNGVLSLPFDLPDNRGTAQVGTYVEILEGAAPGMVHVRLYLLTTNPDGSHDLRPQEQMLNEQDFMPIFSHEPEAERNQHGGVQEFYQRVDYPLWHAQPRITDVNQQNIGDCWILATAASLADQHPEMIRQMFSPQTLDADTYEVILFVPQRNGAFIPRRLQVDRFMPSAALPGRVNSANSGTHAQSPVLWPLLIEKAFAELRGGYDDINRGQDPAQAFQILTGRSSDSLWVGNHSRTSWLGDSSTNRIDLTRLNSSSELMAQLRQAVSSHRGVVLSTIEIEGTTDRDVIPNSPNLLYSHAYAVQSITPDGRVQLYNPHGQNHPAPLTASQIMEFFASLAVE